MAPGSTSVVPSGELTEEIFSEGLGFDGSSIRGWKSIEASDMLAMPDPATAFIDPFCAVPTLSLTCTIAETGTKEAYTRDPRGIAQRAEKYLISTGLADSAFFGPEAEFFIFDNVQFDSKSNGTFYSVDSRGSDLEHRPGRDAQHRATRFGTRKAISRSRPADTQQDIRTEMCLVMEELGVEIERQHHEVATAGQAEIDYRFDTLVQGGRRHDGLQVRGQERRPEARQDGVLHAQAALRRQRLAGCTPTSRCGRRASRSFAGNEYAGPVARWRSITSAGLLKHARALCAICNPTTNSYKRLVPGYEAPVNLAYSSRNRSAAIRIPTYSENPKAKRLEYRPPGSGGQSVPGVCGVADGGAGRDPEQDRSGRAAGQEHLRAAAGGTEEGSAMWPGSLGEALDCLEKDHEFLLKGDVFTQDFLDMWIATKRKEHDALRLRPHPYEFFLYYDV